MRDFPTLIEAAEGLSTQIRIAASLVVHLGGLRATVTDVRETLPARADVSVSQLTALELRDAYRAAEVVVVPLYPSDMDNGVNVILEAMAAGRPVVASRIPGQVDVITHGKTGYYVDPENPEDLRRMLVHLRDNPEEAERVADEGRRYVASVHDLETFADNVRARLIEINGGQSSRATPWWAEASVSPDSLRTSGCRRSQTAGRLRASR
ncbi:glycosyltransferase [Terracoccus luteus]|nr:glycosyltransferase family 4 protein [Terracoccus luteus]